MDRCWLQPPSTNNPTFRVNPPSCAQTLLVILLDGFGCDLRKSKAPEGWGKNFSALRFSKWVFSARNGGLERLSRNQSAHSLKVFWAAKTIGEGENFFMKMFPEPIRRTSGD